MNTLLHTIKYDCRSSTGSNLRRIMLMTIKTNVNEIDLFDIKNMVYKKIPIGSAWKIDMINEIVDIKSKRLSVPGFHISEIDSILNYICTI